LFGGAPDVCFLWKQAPAAAARCRAHIDRQISDLAWMQGVAQNLRLGLGISD